MRASSKRCWPEPSGSLLRRHFIEPQEAQEGYSRSQVALDDVLDAYALAITASRLYGQSAMRLPEVQIERDSKRLRMEIWY